MSPLNYRVEAKLALPQHPDALSATADSVARYDLFENYHLPDLVASGPSAGWSTDDIRCLFQFQPLLMVCVNKPKVGGARQLTMHATSVLRHRLALGLDDGKGANVVYGLLQEGEFLRLYVAHMEQDAGNRTWGRRFVCFIPLCVLLRLKFTGRLFIIQAWYGALQHSKDTFERILISLKLPGRLAKTSRRS